jgi:methylmalonyl-CoA/ethylmalonyl-CoA epimerase
MNFKFELDHIGIATESIENSPFFKILGLIEGGVETVPTEKVKVGFFKTDNNASIELLEPTDSQSPISQFLSKRGPGIHHICFRVQEIDKIVEHLKSKNIQLINEVPKVGAHNCRVVFIHPKSTGGVLVELSEKVKS